MTPFFRVLLQDLRDLRWLIALWLLAHSALAFRAIVPPEPSRLPGPELIFIAVALLWIILLGRIMFAHPAADDRAAWRTRPISGMTIGWGKLAVACVLLVVVPAVLGAVKYAYLGLPPSLLARLSLTAMLVTSCPLALLLVVASFCRTSGRFLFVLGALLVGTPVTLSLFGRQFHQWHLSAGELIALGLMGTVGSVALLLAQYHRPRTGRHSGALIVLVLVLGVGAWALRTAPPQRSLLPPDVQLEVTDIELQFVEPPSRAQHATGLARKKDRLQLQGRVRASGLPPDRLWDLSVGSITTVPASPDAGFSVTSGVTKSYPLEVLAAAAGVDQLQWSYGHWSPRWSFSLLSPAVPTAERTRWQNSRVTIEGVLDWKELRIERVGVIPLQIGAVHRGSGVRLEILDRPDFDSALSTRLSAPTLAAFGEVVLVMVLPGSHGVLLQPTHQSSVALGSYRTSTYHHALDGIVDSWEGAELQIYRLVPVSTGQLPFSIPNVLVQP